MDTARPDPSAATPLLSPPVALTSDDQIPQRRKSPTVIVVILLLYLVFLDLGYELIQPAQTRVLEAIFCRQYYEQLDPRLVGRDGKGGVDETWCKVQEMQGDLAMLKGWQLTFD